MRQTISKYNIAFRIMLVQVRKDYMLFMALFAPILAGVFIHFGIPYINTLIETYLHKENLLIPYYRMFDLLLAIVGPLMIGFISAMVILGEMDDKMIAYFSVTPILRKGYLITRLFYPTAAGAVYTIIICMLFHISDLTYVMQGIICLVSCILGVIVCLFIISISTNKVEGMALGKLSGFIICGVFVPFLITNNMQYLGAFLPSFWLGKYVMKPDWISLFLCLFVSFVWYALLYRRFSARSYR